MAAGSEVARKGSSGAARSAKKNRKADVVEALNVEQGVDAVTSYISTFGSVSLTGLSKNQNELFQEVMRRQGEDAGPTVRQLVAMRRMDGQARALYRLLTLPIRAALKTATIIGDDDSEEERQFIDDVFHLAPESGGMTVTFNRFMGQLLQGLFDGFAAFEKVFWIPEEGPLAGKVTLKKLAHRPSETVTFVIDKTGGFSGIRQRTFYYGKPVDVFIPKNRCFYWAAQEEEEKFYGVSFFESAFYHYDKKARLYYASHLASFRAAVGTRIGTVPAGASSKAKSEFAASMANLSMAQWLMMPEGFKVEVLQEGGNYDFLAQINHHNSAMSKSILANFFDKDQGAGQSEASLVNFGQPGDEMFNLMLRAIQNDIADQINHYIIPQLIDLNFGTARYPKFTWGALTDEQNAAIAKTFDKLASQQTITPEFIRAMEEHQAKEFGLDIDYDEVDLREEEEAEAEAALGAMPGQEGAVPGAEPGGLPGSPPAAPGALPEPPAPGGAPTPPVPAGDPAEPPTDDAGPSAAPASAEGVESPEAWSSLADFEEALGIEESEDEENDDFEEQLTLSVIEDFENRLELSAALDDYELSLSRDEDNLLTMAQSLLDAAGGYANA
jgi:hypothetical protein